MSFLDLFKRKNYASPYYGKGNKALFTSPPMIQQPKQEDEVKTTPAPVHYTPTKPAEPDWEQRRFEMMKMLVAELRRSVVLGKLKASDKKIAAMARSLTDAAINELINNPMNDGTGEEED